ncbi:MULTISPECIES: ATP-binding protein [Bacillus]|uniref:ATP-binding protein n=1 Tax=Bacillus TaxID=1386 RepID=UPI0004680D90|nr:MULTISPECIES: ATP-binding protein [Bacillus]MED1411855.1 ATP-binding protein [Bacillus paramycoides]MED1465344.1 ATP-binding protein [Bacillus paramycoides]MED1490991.1 ATP-binding protein [Bacillus paramycoides]
MEESFLSAKEEKKNAKIFLWVLHVIVIVYEAAYAIILEDKMPLENWHKGILKLAYIMIILGIGVYLFERGKAHLVKYTYLFAYMIAEIFNIGWYAFHNTIAFDEGNVIEFIFIFFVPIFLSKRYLFILAPFLIGKYMIYLFVFGELNRFIPLVMNMLLLFVSYIILNRFVQYFSAVKKSIAEASQAQKLAVIGKMAATVGHEIKNPLASLKGFTQLQKEKHEKDATYGQMILEIENMNNMISELMEVATCKPSVYEKHIVSDVLVQALEKMHEKMDELNINFTFNEEHNRSEIECDKRKLKGVFLYVIKNALEAMEHGGTLQIQVEDKKRDYVVISIVDSGFGIKKENLGRVTEAFYTTKQDKIGLGLTLAERIITENLGELHISSEVKKGTRVEILLPKKLERNVTQE